MGHACTHDELPRRPERGDEHPVTAILAVVAIVLAILLIAAGRVAVHGTADLQALVAADEAGLHSTGRSAISNDGAPENEAASSRWATGFSH